MITYVEGDLFEAPAKTLVNAVNTVGVMGKGVAKTFKALYPDMFQEYQKLCERGGFTVGKLWLFKSPSKWILNFPTKQEWRSPSEPAFVERGLRKFAETYAELGITSVAFPRLGCGNGELNWDRVVHPLFLQHLKKLPIDIFVYTPPHGTAPPEHRDIVAMTEWLRSDPASLGFSEVWADLLRRFDKAAELCASNDSRPFLVDHRSGPAGLRIRTGIVDSWWLKMIHQLSQLLNFANPKRIRITGPTEIFVPREAVLDLWENIRAYGFLEPARMPEGLDVLAPYLLPVLQQLPYLKPVNLSNSRSPNTRIEGLRIDPRSLSTRQVGRAIAPEVSRVVEKCTTGAVEKCTGGGTLGS